MTVKASRAPTHRAGERNMWSMMSITTRSSARSRINFAAKNYTPGMEEVRVEVMGYKSVK